MTAPENDDPTDIVDDRPPHWFGGHPPPPDTTPDDIWRDNEIERLREALERIVASGAYPEAAIAAEALSDD